MATKRESQLGRIGGGGIGRIGGIEKRSSSLRSRTSMSRTSFSRSHKPGDNSIFSGRTGVRSWGPDRAAVEFKRVQRKILRMPLEQRRKIARWYPGKKGLLKLAQSEFPKYSKKEGYYLDKQESRKRYLEMRAKERAAAKRNNPDRLRVNRLNEALRESGIILKRKHWM